MLLHCEHISKADSYFHNNNCGYTSGAEMSQTNKRQPFRQALFYHSPAKHWLGTNSLILRKLFSFFLFFLHFAFYSDSTFMGKIKTETLTLGTEKCIVLIVLLLYLVRGVFSYYNLWRISQWAANWFRVLPRSWGKQEYLITKPSLLLHDIQTFGKVPTFSVVFFFFLFDFL